MRSPAERARLALLGVALAVVGCSRSDGDAGEPDRDAGAGSSAALVRTGGAPDAVRVDGRFDEWARVAPLARDPADAPDAAIDLREIRALDDPRSLYLSLDVGREVNAQSLPGTLRLLIDADDDATSGGSLHGTVGVDLVLTTSYMADPSAERGFGFAVRAFEDGALASAVDPYPLDVLVAPTSSASRFELRVSRHGSSEPPLPRLGPRIRLRAVYVEGGVTVDWTDAVPYDFTTPADPAKARDAVATEARLARPEGTVRVAQMNVASGSFPGQAEDFARLLAALDPDVLLLDELPGDVGDREMSVFLALPSLARLGAWQVTVGAAGGRQRSAVATRLGGLEPAVAFADVRYAEGALEELQAGVPERFHAAVDAERRRGLSAAGAWVPVGDRDVLFIALDLQATGWIDSAEDRLRVLQAATILGRARTALGRRQPRAAGTPRGVTAVIGGDFNLVGSRTPLDVLGQVLSGGAAAGGTAGATSSGAASGGLPGGTPASPLEPVEAERLGERSLATWRSPGAPFAPGRLDYLLVPTAHFEVANAFAFTTEDLPEPVLARLGLEADLSGRLSDHVVLVADLRSR